MLRGWGYARPRGGDANRNLNPLHSDGDRDASDGDCYLDAGHAYSDCNREHLNRDPRYTDCDGHTVRNGWGHRGRGCPRHGR